MCGTLAGYADGWRGTLRRELDSGSPQGCIKKVGEDYERMKFNTAIAAMMSLVNDIYAKGDVTRDELHTLLVLMNPVAPHITEEMNSVIGFDKPIYERS